MPENENPDSQPKPSENEIADYYDGMKKLEMQGHESGIKKARNALFFTAGLFLILEIIQANASGVPWTPLMIGIVVVEVGVFVLLGLWTKSKPFTAIIVGLILYLLIWVVAIITVPGGRGFYGGILVRIIVIGILISALKPAKAWEDLKKSR